MKTDYTTLLIINGGLSFDFVVSLWQCPTDIGAQYGFDALNLNAFCSIRCVCSR